jgi:hypothetical protein
MSNKRLLESLQITRERKVPGVAQGTTSAQGPNDEQTKAKNNDTGNSRSLRDDNKKANSY